MRGEERKGGKITYRTGIPAPNRNCGRVDWCSCRRNTYGQRKTPSHHRDDHRIRKARTLGIPVVGAGDRKRSLEVHPASPRAINSHAAGGRLQSRPRLVLQIPVPRPADQALGRPGQQVPGPARRGGWRATFLHRSYLTQPWVGQVLSWWQTPWRAVQEAAWRALNTPMATAYSQIEESPQ